MKICVSMRDPIFNNHRDQPMIQVKWVYWNSSRQVQRSKQVFHARWPPFSMWWSSSPISKLISHVKKDIISKIWLLYHFFYGLLFSHQFCWAQEKPRSQKVPSIASRCCRRPSRNCRTSRPCWSPHASRSKTQATWLLGKAKTPRASGVTPRVLLDETKCSNILSYCLKVYLYQVVVLKVQLLSKPLKHQVKQHVKHL